MKLVINFRSSLSKIWTTFRSELSISLKTYVPAGSTMPGTSTCPLNVTLVFMFHSSAPATEGKARTHKPANTATTGARPIRACLCLVNISHSSLFEVLHRSYRLQRSEANALDPLDTEIRCDVASLRKRGVREAKKAQGPAVTGRASSNTLTSTRRLEVSRPTSGSVVFIALQEPLRRPPIRPGFCH